MHYLSHVLGLPSDRIGRRSLVALVNRGTYYPEGSLFSDCEVEYLHETAGDSDEPIRLACQSGVADVITIADDLYYTCCILVWPKYVKKVSTRNKFT